MAMREPKQTRTQRVYEQIRADIYAARLRPGQRLKFPDLCASYDTSVGVAREALARLAAERLVRPQAHQGYTVADLSEAELTDLTIARAEVESLTFRRAVLHGSPEWEADVLSKHHLLSRLAVPTDQASEADTEHWNRAHEDFHRALLAGCESQRLREVAIGLREEAELYRHWVIPLGHWKDRNAAAEHQALTDAALSRDADRASDLLRAHISHTTQVLIGAAAADPAAHPGVPGQPAPRP